MSSRRNYVGAKWWKFDFHTHTPESYDFGQKDVTPEYWLKQFMEKGIDCVAITDHDSGGWVDKLKDALQKINQEKPDWHRPLTLFPGVEISVGGNLHLLAIFDPEKTTSDIDQLLGAVDYSKEGGSTTKSFPDAVKAIHKRGGLAIPAHVNRKKGLFVACKGADTWRNID